MASVFDALEVVEPKKEATGSVFDELELAEEPVAKASVFDEIEAQPPEPEEGGLVEGKDVTQAEIQDIAARNRTNPELLKMFAPYMGRSVEGEEGLVTTARRGIGLVSEALGGLPTWLAKKTLSEDEQRAVDELNALTERKKSTLQKAGEIIGGVATPTGMVAKAGKAGIATMGAIEGAMFGLGESKAGEELGSAALGGGIGLAGGAIFGPLILRAGAKAGEPSKVIDDTVEESIEALRKEASPETAQIAEVVEKQTLDKLPAWKAESARVADAVDPEKLSPELQESIQSFSQYLGGGRVSPAESIARVQDLKAKLSPDDFEKAYTRHKQLTDDTITRELAALTKEEPNIVRTLRAVKNAAVDFMSVARNIDRRKGTEIYQELLDATKKTNLYQVELGGLLRAKVKLNDAYDSLKEAGQIELREALTGTGRYQGLSEKEIAERVPENMKESYNGWRNWFETSRQRANELLTMDESGVRTSTKEVIAKRENYLPDQMMDMPRAIVAIEQKIREAAKALNVNPLKLTEADDIKRLAQSGPMAELVRAATYLTGKAPQTGAELSTVLKKAIEPGSDVYVNELKASALMQRTGLMPEFLKEKDIKRLANRWAQQTMRYAYLKDSLANLTQQAQFLRKAGAEDDAKKIERLHDEFLGQARFVAKATRQAATWLQTKALRIAARQDDGVSQRFFTNIAEAPDVFQNAILNVYPNFLGLSPRAVVQNLVGGLYMMIPEVGNIYGTRAVLPAYLRALKNVGSADYWRALEKEGFIAPQWTTELKEAITSGKAPGIIGRGMDKAASVAMSAFEWSEKMNRAVAYETGRMIAKDALAGQKAALKYLDTMPPRLKKKALDLVKSQDANGVESLITRYFADRTLFSYNRITSSEFSRAVGPLFSMFTKYPSSVAGRILETLAEGGWIDGGKELVRWLMAPIMAGVAINNLLLDPAYEAAPSDFVNEEFFFGKPNSADSWARGAVLSSPFFTVKGILEGRMFAPPLVGTVKETTAGILELMEGDPERLGRAIRNSARAYTPGGAQAFITLTEQLTGEDIPILGKEE
jgi:hypothetical protein